MRVAFMGTPEFAVPVLSLLARSHEVAGVVTRPDAVRGRGRRLVPSPVKERALELGVPVIEHARMTPEATGVLAELAPDVICVAAFGCILPKRVLALPRLGCVNVHASLLPRWRGAAPIERAILAGDAETGVSIMAMEEGLDTGPVAWQASVPCAGRACEDVRHDISYTGGYGLLDVLEALEDNEVAWRRQDDELATYAPRIEKGELDLSPALSAEENMRHVLASSDAHVSRVAARGTLLRVRRARLSSSRAPAGALCVERDGSVILGCADGALELAEVTPAGKRPMDARSWARGLHEKSLAWERP